MDSSSSLQRLADHFQRGNMEPKILTKVRIGDRDDFIGTLATNIELSAV